MNILLFIGGWGGAELIVILFVVLLLFGGRKIPELARGLGKGIKEFNNARTTVEKELKEGMRQVELEERQQAKKNEA
ncbi:MAG: twin-arginine translocase TatA/TatE family subunit [Bacteroidota bacterium]